MGDIKKRGKLYSMLSEITKPGTTENILIKAQYNCFSDKTEYSGSFIPILHEYVLIVRKDNPLLIPIITTKKLELDIRDMHGATWRDIVAAVLENEGGSIPLSVLYEKVAPYKKARQNQWWKEKVRQTLQLHPNDFESTQRGMWQLKRAVA